jgi:hypothetical protein
MEMVSESGMVGKCLAIALTCGNDFRILTISRRGTTPTCILYACQLLFVERGHEMVVYSSCYLLHFVQEVARYYRGFANAV